MDAVWLSQLRPQFFGRVRRKGRQQQDGGPCRASQLLSHTGCLPVSDHHIQALHQRGHSRVELERLHVGGDVADCVVNRAAQSDIDSVLRWCARVDHVANQTPCAVQEAPGTGHTLFVPDRVILEWGHEQQIDPQRIGAIDLCHFVWRDDVARRF